jgi:hypothetical protein
MITDSTLSFELFIKNCPTPTANSTQENHTLLCSIPTTCDQCHVRSALCGSCCRQLQCCYSQRNIKEYYLPFGFLSPSDIALGGETAFTDALKNTTILYFFKMKT